MHRGIQYVYTCVWTKHPLPAWAADTVRKACIYISSLAKYVCKMQSLASRVQTRYTYAYGQSVQAVVFGNFNVDSWAGACCFTTAREVRTWNISGR